MRWGKALDRGMLALLYLVVWRRQSLWYAGRGTGPFECLFTGQTTHTFCATPVVCCGRFLRFHPLLPPQHWQSSTFGSQEEHSRTLFVPEDRVWWSTRNHCWWRPPCWSTIPGIATATPLEDMWGTRYYKFNESRFGWIKLFLCRQ